MSLLFNQVWLNERLLTNYTYFKIHDPASHEDTNTQNNHRRLIKWKIYCSKGKNKHLKYCIRDNFGILIYQNYDTFQENWMNLHKII